MPKSNAYWKKRFEAIEAASNSYGQEVFRQIEPSFDTALRRIEGQIQAWYGRFADNNQITMQEARKLLNSKELKEFKWDVQEYIKYGHENSMNQLWMKELENASARFHISRLEALKIRTQQAAEVAFGNELDAVDKMARKVFTEDYYHSIFEMQKGFNIGWEIGQVDEEKLSKLISKPWAADGKHFSDRIWDSRTQLVSELHSQLTRTCILGKAPDDAIKAISKKFHTSKSQAGRLVMTEQAYFHSVAQQEAFKDLEVEDFEIVATLDSHTSEICQEMDGKHFPMKDYEAGVTAPPFHPWCRSVTVPWFEDNYGGKRAAKDEQGKTYYVPDSMTYKDWKQSMVDGQPDDLKDISNGGIINTNNWVGLNYTQTYTKQTAIDRLQNEYGIHFNDSRKYSMDGDLLCDCVGWMDSFNSQYPGFMKQNPCKIPVIENKAPSKMKRVVGQYRYYMNNPNVVEIALNGQYHSNVVAFQQYVEQCVQSKWYPANAKVHKTFVHEFGHHVSNSMRWITNNSNWQTDFIQECIDDFKKVEPNYTYNTYIGMGDYVSRYGATSESELFAEAFAEYFGGENPREFAKIFGKKLEALLKGVK